MFCLCLECQGPSLLSSVLDPPDGKTIKKHRVSVFLFDVLMSVFGKKEKHHEFELRWPCIALESLHRVTNSACMRSCTHCRASAAGYPRGDPYGRVKDQPICPPKRIPKREQNQCDLNQLFPVKLFQSSSHLCVDSPVDLKSGGLRVRKHDKLMCSSANPLQSECSPAKYV